MKFYKFNIAVLFLVTALFSGCSDFDDKVEPSPATPDGCQGVYFPSSNPKVFELEPTDATEITLTIAREVSAGAVNVPIIVEINGEDVFNAPETVSFADGEKEVGFTVTFPTAGEGVTYGLKLAVAGDQYVNPYSAAKPYLSTSVTRIKWEVLAEPVVYNDGAFQGIYGGGNTPMYVHAEKAQLGSSVRYRFKNAFKYGTGVWNGDSWVATPDADGIYDGYASTWPGEFDETKDYYTTIEIYDPKGVSGEVFMFAHEIGVAWSKGMMSMGSIYKNLSTDKGKYPLGKIANGVITFGANSLYFSEADRNNGGKYPSATPTVIYLTKEAFIAANMKIEDFNDVEYVRIPGAVNEFVSAAFDDSWSQPLAKAVDIDAENEASEYKNLYYLADLYNENFGVAFYYEEGKKVKIPASQPIGVEAFGKQVFVSPSETIESSVEVNSKGVTIYTLGLMFHFEDGTILGEFAEKFYYSKQAVSYSKADFLGNFVMTGPSLFEGDPDVTRNVKVAEGTEANTFVITGIQYAAEITATFDPENSIMSIAPQTLADIISGGTAYDATLYTFNGGVSDSAPIDLVFNIEGNLIVSPASDAFGYLIRSEAAGGWLNGYYNMEFAPSLEKSASAKVQSINSINVKSLKESVTRDGVKEYNFKIQGKKSLKEITNTMSNALTF